MEATRAAQRIFGPSVSCARARALDRDCRFHVFVVNDKRGFFGDASDGPPVSGDVLLGSGPDYGSAIEHAKTTPNGQLAIKTAQAGQEFAKKALLSKSELEFADLVEEQVVNEALEKGANEAAIAAIRHRFAKAKEKINESVSRESKAGTDQGADGSSDRPDHEGGGSKD